MELRISTMYFSPTGTTGKIVSEIAGALCVAADIPASFDAIDFADPETRKKPVAFSGKDLVVIGVPVYAGRVPNVLLPYLNSFDGGGASVVAVVLYGNRNYDDALIELTDILTEHNFRVVAAGAFIGEHSFSDILASGRPDGSDISIARDFAGRISRKLDSNPQPSAVTVNGQKPYRPYYVPKDENGNPVYDFRKIKPLTSSACNDCKLCAQICPVGSIDFDDVSLVSGICIKCCACVKRCPEHAKFFDDTSYTRHRLELEDIYAARKDPELFL